MNVHLGGHLGYYGPQKQSRFTVHLDTPMRLTELLAQLGVPIAEVAVAAINGEPTDVQAAIIQDGDRLDLLPPIGGGTNERMASTNKRVNE